VTGVAAPRLVVAGLSGDSGKTLVALALLLAARERALTVRGFKKGPDYIDAAWAAWASGAPARNLDTFLTGPDEVAARFAAHAARSDTGTCGALNVIEGNRGLFDGTDAAGTHSTAALAKVLAAPVILVVSARKVTATAAALVRGCQVLDPDLAIAGVVLNQVAGRRHEAVAREAIERACGVPVLGAIPRLGEAELLPGRHLGLVPPVEHQATAGTAETLRRIAREHLDVERLLACAAAAPSVERRAEALRHGAEAPRHEVVGAAAPVSIGYLADSAFSFYYPENLEALEARGARLVPLSSLAATAMPPDVSALYIGGGFPETHAAAIARNRPFLGALRAAAAGGLPVFAECGGLMLLARSLAWRGQRHEMAGVLPIDVEVLDAPQGHGYVVLAVDRPNPFFDVDAQVRGHEFHYSRLVGDVPDCACAVVRGTGCGAGRDAIVVDRVWASYTHLHAAGVPEWANGMVRAARAYRAQPGGEA
jgi:cobyrinic acid a,c-diamide synthase